MAILNQTPIPLAEISKYLSKSEEKRPIDDYLKKFAKAPKGKIEEFASDLRDLKNHKIKETDIVKIIDLLPKDAEDLNKIFNDVSLAEEEINSILEIVKKHS